MPSEPVLDEAAIEVVVRRKTPLGLSRDALLMARVRAEVRRDVATYLAALDREALIERVATVLVAAQHYPTGPHDIDRLMARSILLALGLIPTEGGDER